MGSSVAKKVRIAIIVFSVLSVLGTFALFAYMTQERTSSHSADGYYAYWIYDPCSGSNSTALSLTATYNDAYITSVCPWGFWDLVVGYVAIIFSLGFLGSLVVRRWKLSLRMLRLTLLLGFLASVLLILAFIKLLSTINTQITFDDYTVNGVTMSYSEFECDLNAGLVLLSFLTVLGSFLFEGWSYKKNANGISSTAPLKRALI